MIFRHFADERTGGHSYLIASPTTRQAAIVNPSLAGVDAYRQALAELGLRLDYTLRTDRNGRCEEAARRLEDLFNARRLSPSSSAGHCDGHDTTTPGHVIMLGDVRIEVCEPPNGYSGEVAYRVSSYMFAGSSVLIDWNEGPVPENGEPEAIFDDPRPASAPDAPAARTNPIENRRTTRTGVCLERLILEDLHTSLAESRFTPKEARVVQTYIRAMEENDFAPPTAATVSDLLGNVDRTAVHVLVHNIRWKQIDVGRLPLLLAGQTSKWLRGLQTKPEFTSHEREFLETYLGLLRQLQRPPSGPEIAASLVGGRSVQWVRKRAHTIRRKQREFEMPELVLTRKAESRASGPVNGAPSHRAPCSKRFDLDLQYGA